MAVALSESEPWPCCRHDMARRAGRERPKEVNVSDVLALFKAGKIRVCPMSLGGVCVPTDNRNGAMLSRVCESVPIVHTHAHGLYCSHVVSGGSAGAICI
jgi:hypothetical protein